MKLSHANLWVVALFSGQAFAFDADLKNVLGYPIGIALPQELVGEAQNDYPTRLITLNVLDFSEIKIFDEIQVQIIESNKKVYSISAEKYFPDASACSIELKSIFDVLDRKYKKLKVEKTIHVSGKVFSIFDGYLSKDGERKLSISCGQKGSQHMLMLSARDISLSIDANKLWSQY
ncbi:hypothetical protein [Photobacterium sp. 53610]|uniref:hypothetical protein n=1 Tax=Photobacterium sp. 53610 TaxID=3102789 RepID=UPI002ED88B1F